jgi:hypothetical protein
MVDTQRFQLGPGLIQVVGRAAGRLAQRQESPVSPLQVTTYVPLDVDSVGRILESLEEDYAIERVQTDGLCHFRVDDADALAKGAGDIDAGDHLRDHDLFESNLADLKSDEGWTRKVFEQHEILSIAAAAQSRELELTYFQSRSEIPSSKIQSILNDFDAEGYIGSNLEEDSDSPSFRFPPIDYPNARRSRNMAILDETDSDKRNNRIWLALTVAVAILLVFIILVRFYF